MNYVLTELCKEGITNPQQIQQIAFLMQAATMDREILREAAELSEMSDNSLKHAIQQVIGGQ